MERSKNKKTGLTKPVKREVVAEWEKGIINRAHTLIEEKKYSPYKIILAWSALGAIAVVIALAIMGNIKLEGLSGTEVVFFSLALAFAWVEKLKWGSVKPLNCVPCMTGWFSLLLAFIFHVPNALFYLPAGLFVGSIFERLKMRYL